MYAGKLVFSQVMDHLPWHTFQRCVRRYHGNHKVKSFQCSDQYRSMAFAQLTYRESLRGIETCLRAQASKLYHMGITSGISRNTLANANQTRDWRLYADFAQRLIHTARRLHIDQDPGLDVANTVYALDSSTIDLCLTLFPWAHFRKTKSAIKLHTLLDLRGHIPAFIHISDGKLHDVNVLDLLLPEAGAFYIMDRGYLDFARLYRLHQARCFFLLRAKSNTRFRRLYSHAVDRSSGLICDQTIMLTGVHSATHYPDKLRRIKYHDTDYLGGLFDQRRRHPRADLISDLIAVEAGGDRLSQAELFGICSFLLEAGHETTTGLIGNGLLALLRNPGQLRKLQQNPALIAPAVEECLRYDGPIQRISRVVIADLELRGKRLRPGQRIWAMQGAANRDPQQFPEPDRFDILRRNNRHVAFGYGVHHCLGAPLARIEGQIAFLALLRLPELRLENPAPEWQEGVSLRTPKSLPVRFRGS